MAININATDEQKLLNPVKKRALGDRALTAHVTFRTTDGIICDGGANLHRRNK